MIYFDNAATTLVDESVLKSFEDALKLYFANPSSLHHEGLKALEIENKARKLIAKCFNDENFDVIFTSGATEANNLAIKGIAYRYQKNGKHLVTSKIEHPSVREVFHHLEQEGFIVDYLDVDEHGHYKIDELEKMLDNETILVSLMLVNNETGAIQDLKKVKEIIKKYPKVKFHSDVTQAYGKIDFDYSIFDLISFSGHKIHSFKQSGALLKKKNILIEPEILGGGQQDDLRSGTSDVPREIALAKAVRLAKENQKANYEHAISLKKHLVAGLKDIEGIEVNSGDDDSPFIVSIYVPKKGSVVAESLSNKEIYVSTKSACSSKKEMSSYVLEAYGKNDKIAQNSIRISFDRENTLSEVDEFLKVLKQILIEIK